VSAVIALTMPRTSRPGSSRKNAYHRVKAFVTPERAPNDTGYRATIKGLGVCPASDYPDFAVVDTKKYRVVVELAKCQTDTNESCWVLFLLGVASEVRPSLQPRMLTPAPPGKNQTRKQNKKNRAKAKKGGKGLSHKEIEKWEEKMKRSTNG